MKVLILSPYGERLDVGDDERVSNIEDAEFVISYGHREIIKKDVIERFPLKIINLHISYLPWNKGADPNFWSWFSDTPKGVTIHHIDEGIDTGDILTQKLVLFGEDETLASSYKKLHEEIVRLFNENWHWMRGGVPGTPQKGIGSNHRVKDNKFQLGYDVLIKDFLVDQGKMCIHGNWREDIKDGHAGCRCNILLRI